MKLKEFIENLNEFVKENPDALEFEVITSKDDEGNGFNRVFYTPTKGFYNEEDFTSHNQFDDFNLDDESLNSVCIN